MSGIPAELERLAVDRVRLEMLDRHDAFRVQTQRIIEEMSARGVLHSGMTRQRIRDAVRAEVEIRALLAWQVLARVISGESLPPNDGVVAAAKRFVSTVVDSDCGDLRAQIDRLPTFGGGPGDDFTELTQRALRKAESEIEITLRKAGRSGEPSGTIVNVYQPYGIVQTGAGSTATFFATITENKQVILQALDAVQSAIAEAPDIDDSIRGEAAELVVEAREELSRAQPNQLRIRTVLSGIATTIQTLGSAAGAYQALKGAAALIGLTLP